MARKKKTAKETILSLIPKLSKYEFEEVAQFVELSHINFHLENLQREVKETRYCEGQYTCDTHIVKNGTQKGVQRYLCRQCRKSFSDQTATPTPIAVAKASKILCRQKKEVAMLILHSSAHLRMVYPDSIHLRY